MVASTGCRVAILLTCFSSLFRFGLSQRPTNASVCDYYAQAQYGTNSSDTQLKWIQNVVCLAFEGGSTLNNVSSDLTGILRPGKFNNIDIDLLHYFNGSTKSTNVNNAAIGVNWLDDGGATPLAAFLSGKSQALSLDEEKNQYHLFSNFFVGFARSFGCTLPPAPLPKTNGPVSLAYAHKFMDLEYHQLGYFINQLSLAAVHYGASAQDADTFRSSMNSRFNVRCAPAFSSNPASPPQLMSLCQNPTCPLAVPVSDCAAYVNLTASGTANSNPTTVTSVATMTAAPSDASSSAAPTSGTAPADPDKLSTGAIAGIAIGGAAVLLIAIIALVYFRRKRRPSAAAIEPAPPPGWDQHNFSTPTMQPPSAYSPKHPSVSYYSTNQPPDARLRGASPDSQDYHFSSGHPSEIWSPVPVEMEGTQSAQSMHGMSPATQNGEWSKPQRHSEGLPGPGQGQYVQQ
ncbi:hypothetical protein N0V87_005516 [Didymella glomerata]|uniref:Uncharacterized protein n=1 Tax=Didymella glomerata TaxID=749621 RepID=A0A9W8WY82_9PLEO|nr:hypothetical protein N0V87_005516 [Didymella glomerata]